jgi:hypothetical protein
MKESQLQPLILLALSKAGCKVWRCETAGAWVGKTIYRVGDTVTLADARMIQAGLTKGGADIIGISPDGRFLAVEVKTATGSVRPEQAVFIKVVQEAGGIAGVARSVDEALALLKQC